VQVSGAVGVGAPRPALCLARGGAVHVDGRARGRARWRDDGRRAAFVARIRTGLVSTFWTRARVPSLLREHQKMGHHSVVGEGCDDGGDDIMPMDD